MNDTKSNKTLSKVNVYSIKQTVYFNFRLLLLDLFWNTTGHTETIEVGSFNVGKYARGF